MLFNYFVVLCSIWTASNGGVGTLEVICVLMYVTKCLVGVDNRWLRNLYGFIFYFVVYYIMM